MINTMQIAAIKPPQEDFAQQEPSGDIFKITRPKPNDPEEKEVASELRNRMMEALAADHEWRQNARFELNFLDNHWLEEESGREANRSLEEVGRAAFNIDLLNPAIDLVVNQSRINKISASFIPLSEGADEKTAEIRQGLYRQIERESKGAICRETAYQFAVSVGRGYYRILVEDEEGATFDQRIGMQRCDNLDSIVVDPTCLDFNYEDAAWAYCFDDLWKQQFVQQYRTTLTPYVDTQGAELTDDQRNLWFPKDKVRVGEYFRKVWRRRELWKLTDGTDCWADEAPKTARPIRVKSKMDYIIEWRRMTGTQTLEKGIWPGKFIPIVVMIGREVFRGTRGKIHRGMIRPAIAPSRIHDVMFSRMVDEVGLSPLPHMLAPVDSFTPDQLQIVNSINRHPWSVVQYKVIQDGSDRQVQPPQWVSPSPNTAAVVQAAELASQKLDRVLNTYAPNRGQAIADQSGRAIREIKESGDVSHAAFPDNFNRAILYEAKVINDLMDVVYTEERAITIVHPDDRTSRVMLNKPFTDKRGVERHYKFGSDQRYGVAIVTAPQSPSDAADRVQHILQLCNMFPQMGQALDLIIKDLNIPGAEKYEDRVRPPGFSDEDEGESVQQLRQKLQMLQQQEQLGHDTLQKALGEIKRLSDETFMKTMEIESRERIAAGRYLTDVEVADMKMGHAASMAVLEADLQNVINQLGTPKPPPPPAAGSDAAPPAAAAPAPASPQPAMPPPGAGAPSISQLQGA